MSRRTAAAFGFVALLYTLHGLLPGRLLVPADLPRDFLAWKGRSDVRVRVSNSLLSDVALQFVPWDVESRRLLGAGEWPWRNRFAGEGAPLFSNPQAALLSPFTWPRQIAGLRGWAWSALMKLLAAALGMYWLGRVVGLSEGAACVSALVFALCGFTTTLVLHPHTNVFVILPALCAAALRLARRVSGGRVAAVAALAALATAGGHPETIFIGAMSVLLFVVVNREAASRLRVVLAASAAGFLLLAIQIVPFSVLLWQSHARVARASELPAHFRALSVVSLFLPGFLGSPLRNELDLTGSIPNAGNFVTRNMGYIGALVLLSIILSFRELPPVLRRGLTIGLGGLLLSWWIPGIRDVLLVLPVIRWIAFDYFVIPFALFASLAAGPALMLAMEADRRPRLAALLVLSGVAMVVIGALPYLAPDLLLSIARAGIKHLQTRGNLPQPADVYVARLATYLAAARWTAFRRAFLPGLCWTAFGSGLLLRSSVWRSRLIVFAALAELACFGYGFAPSIHENEVAPEPKAIAVIKATDPGGHWFVAGAGEAFPANLATLYQVRQVDSYDVLTSEQRTEQLLRAGYDAFLHSFPLHPTESQRAAMGLLGVRFWIGDAGVIEIAGARQPTPPSVDPPEGLPAGVAGTASGVLLLIALLWRARYSHSIVDGGFDEMS
jgi:hypothetical protein